MSKFIIVFLSFFFISSIFANDDLDIISRAEWWADESLRYEDSKVWQDIYAKNKEIVSSQTEAQKQAAAKAQAKKDKANYMLSTDFADLMKVSETITQQDWHTLVWPIQKSASIKNIVVHHTHNEYKDSLTAVKSIYNTHAISNGRWDIWYNFLIWYNWEIFEGRAGWDYVIWAHAQWNNRATIWISLIWDYDSKPISEAQYKSLEKLISHLVSKYNINLKQKVPLFKWCISGTCDQNPLLIDSYSYPIVGHRDVWHTTCPWEQLYAQIQKIRTDLTVKQDNFLSYFSSNEVLKTPSKIVKNSLTKALDKLSEQKVIDFLFALEIKIKNTTETKIKQNLEKSKAFIIVYLENKYPVKNNSNSDFDTKNKIKIKLSVPESDTIDISFSDDKNIVFSLVQNKLFANGKEIFDFSKWDFFRIKPLKNNYLTISSWDRKYSWDANELINDNKFKWDLLLYKLWDKIEIVNELYLNDYLKWLWEISNSENSVKAETMIILARSYARYYMTEWKKFPWKAYDGSDNPDEFQRYLWYWLELRSPNLNRIVEKTKNQVLTYNKKLIKPWYFSSSIWKTKSFLEYCKQNNSISFCETESKKYPYLASKIDLWTTNSTYAWHWVWVPWTWVLYLAKANWDANLILKYYLPGVSVEKM